MELLMAKKSINSLVANINRCRKQGTCNSKSKSTVDPKQYAKMKKGWK